jgi:hypothetical protein
MNAMKRIHSNKVDWLLNILWGLIAFVVSLAIGIAYLRCA